MMIASHGVKPAVLPLPDFCLFVCVCVCVHACVCVCVCMCVCHLIESLVGVSNQQSSLVGEVVIDVTDDLDGYISLASARRSHH